MDEKVSKIIKKIESDSKAEAEEILKEAEETASEILSEAEEKAKTIENEILQRGKREAEQEKQRIIANAKLRARKILLDTKEELIDSVFSKVREELSDLDKSKEYPEILSNLIVEAATSIGGNEIILYCRKEDSKILTQEFLKKLSKKLNCKLTLASESINATGGVIARSVDGKIEVDNTLETRMERLKEDLRSTAARILFAGG
jgi:V/A-type H+-transporting ATPase subunit E